MSKTETENDGVDELLASGVTIKQLEEASDTLSRFRAAAKDEWGEVPDWLHVSHVAVQQVLEEHDQERVVLIDNENLDKMEGGAAAVASFEDGGTVLVKATEEGEGWLKASYNND